jgi:histidinol-phosphate aminotransferase
MAGARLGFAIADKAIISDLETIKFSTNPYNINRLTMAAGIAAIKDNGYYMENCRKIEDNRKFTTDALRRLGFDVLDSKANFVFAKSDEIGGEELYLKLKSRGILVRHFTNEKIKEYNRITIGTLDDMKALIEAVEEILRGKK